MLVRRGVQSGFQMGFINKFTYARKVLPAATWRALQPPARGPVHLIFTLADHFEPAIVPGDGFKRVPLPEQERRLEWWVREYPKVIDGWRDHDGRPFIHTYFYPAEQYDQGLLEMLAEHCHAGWGEVEIHLHHGMEHPDNAEHTRQVLTEFRDRLAFRHRCLAVEEGSTNPGYAFVHGNFALANSTGGAFCGVDSEMQILADTGCYADLTLPSGIWNPAQIAKINSVYDALCRSGSALHIAKGVTSSRDALPRLFLSWCRVRWLSTFSARFARCGRCWRTVVSPLRILRRCNGSLSGSRRTFASWSF